MVFDVSNACLGMLNGMVDIANRIELGYSIHVLAEILAVNSIRLAAWENGDEPIHDGDDLDAAFLALRRARRNVWPAIEVTASGRS